MKKGLKMIHYIRLGHIHLLKVHLEESVVSHELLVECIH